MLKRLENRRMWTGARDETNQMHDVKQPKPTRSQQPKTWTERCRLVRWIQVSVVTRSGTADTSGNRARKQTNHSILLTLLFKGTERHVQQEETQDLKTFFFLTVDQMVVCNVKEITRVESYHSHPLHFVTTSISSFCLWFTALKTPYSVQSWVQ